MGGTKLASALSLSALFDCPPPLSMGDSTPYFRAAQASWMRVQAFRNTSSDVA